MSVEEWPLEDLPLLLGWGVGADGMIARLEVSWKEIEFEDIKFTRIGIEEESIDDD